MSEGLIIAPLDAANLLSHGLLTPGPTTGSCRIHKRRLNRSSDEEHSNLALPIPAASLDPSDEEHGNLALPILVESLDASDAFATIPTALISRETLTHVRLSEEKSAELWEIWINWPAFGPGRETDIEDWGFQITFIEFILGGLENQIDATEDDDVQWRACLDACGIDTAGLQDGIMDPHFKYIRLSASCLYWVKDSIEMRYAGLKEIQRSSREREMELQRMAARPSGHQGGDETGGGQRDTHSSTRSRIASQGPRSVSGFQQQRGAPAIKHAMWRSATAIAASNVPGHTVLFKVLDQGRIAGLFNEAGRSDRIGVLLSTAPSDFSASQSLYYFTPDRKVAEYYAAYAKRRANCESVVILCLRIPDAAIESLSPPDIQRLHWPSTEWKELIWHSRTQKQPLPSHLRKYREALLVIGTASKKPGATYYALQSWEGLTDRYLLRVGGQSEPAIQYVFSSEEDGGHEFLVEHGGQDIKVFPYPQSELETWLAENQHST